jgi:hypothetical protein
VKTETLKYRLQLAYKLTPKLADLLHELCVKTVLPTDEVDAVLVHRLRKEMKPHGIVINTKRKLGYWLPDNSHVAIQEAIEPHIGGMHNAITEVLVQL